MKTINLTQNKVILVDDEDYDFLNQWKWYFNNGYAIRLIWNHKSKKIEHIYMHRVILNTGIGMDTDHLNHNGLDNRKANLRVATRSQNQANRVISKNNTSGYKGVIWNKQKNKWQAQIKINRKLKVLGFYQSSKNAALAYNIATVGYFGKFSKTNIIQ
jgi:hypothetical protein